MNCNYNVDKLPVKLSTFHKQVLLAWSLIYRHHFSPHRYLIWNNRDILYKNKSFYFENWVGHQILLVDQLFNVEGRLFSYREFLSTYNFPVTPLHQAQSCFINIPADFHLLLSPSPMWLNHQLEESVFPNFLIIIRSFVHYFRKKLFLFQMLHLIGTDL